MYFDLCFSCYECVKFRLCTNKCSLWLAVIRSSENDFSPWNEEKFGRNTNKTIIYRIHVEVVCTVRHGFWKKLHVVFSSFSCRWRPRAGRFPIRRQSFHLPLFNSRAPPRQKTWVPFHLEMWQFISNSANYFPLKFCFVNVIVEKVQSVRSCLNPITPKCRVSPTEDDFDYGEQNRSNSLCIWRNRVTFRPSGLTVGAVSSTLSSFESVLLDGPLTFARITLLTSPFSPLGFHISGHPHNG